MEFIIILFCAVFWALGFYWLYKGFSDKKKAIKNWCLISFGLCVVVTLTMSTVMKEINFLDTEYLSFYITKIRHVDRWNEYVHQTCTRQVQSGVDKDGRPIYRTETYDCSYVRDHPERWIAYDNSGSEIYIDKVDFDSIKTLWNSPEIFVEMRRKFHTIDGDAQDYKWNKDKSKIITYTISRSYTNRIKGGNSLLKPREVKKEEAEKLGLYDYPKTKYYRPLKSVLSYKEVDPGDEKKFEYFNGYYGMRSEIRIFVLIFPADSVGVSIADDQMAYWEGGNKNEFVICIGKDSLDKVKWASCFSWQTKKDLELRCSSWITRQETLLLPELADWLEANIKYWHRREFREFDYIPKFFNEKQVKIILWTLLTMNVILLSVILYMQRK